MSPVRMDLDSQATSRKAHLNEAVSRAIANVFSTSEVRELFEGSSNETLSTEDQNAVQNILSNVCRIVQQTVESHVDSWTAERGLDQTFGIVDEHCLRNTSVFSEDSITPAFVTPCSSKPGAAYAQVKLNCKKQQLEVLKKELAEKEGHVLQMQTEVSRMVDAVSSLNEQLGKRNQAGTSTADVPSI